MAADVSSTPAYVYAVLDYNLRRLLCDLCQLSLNRQGNLVNLESIHHVVIICADYQRSKIFYTEILGLEIIAENYRPERGSYKLDLALPDGGQIELFSFPHPPVRPSAPEARGLRHLAFLVACLQSSIKELQSLNVSVEAIRVDEFTGKKFTYFQDPDGLPLELYEK